MSYYTIQIVFVKKPTNQSVWLTVLSCPRACLCLYFPPLTIL